MLQPDKVPYQIPMPNNMGMVRYILAIGVLIAHFNELAGASIWWPVSSFNAVGGFFALSGFLMIGSWLRRPHLRSYILSRCRRILPAYWAVVIFFALALWPFSDAPGGYFISSGFWKYLAANLSFLNFLCPSLPGVFDGQSSVAVNGSLWTMKVEWFLYFSLPVVAWFLIKYRRHPGLVIILVYLLSVAYRLTFHHLYISSGSEIYNILSRQFLGQMMYFYSGVMIYYYFSRFIRYRWWILGVSICLAYIGYPSEYIRIIIEPAAISSLVLWFSMVGKWGVWCGRHDNISYNIYLVHFPIVQLCVMYSLCEKLGSFATFMIVVIVSVVLSILINRFIESPLRTWSFQHNI